MVSSDAEEDFLPGTRPQGVTRCRRSKSTGRKLCGQDHRAGRNLQSGREGKEGPRADREEFARKVGGGEMTIETCATKSRSRAAAAVERPGPVRHEPGARRPA